MLSEYGFVEETDGEMLDSTRTVRLVTVDKLPIYVEPGDVPSDSSSIIFASKHVSGTNTPALTVHTTGNLTKTAEFGGKPEEVSFVDPARMQIAIQKLRKAVSEETIEIDLTLEATHHGPTSFPVPVCFVEIGSGTKEWTDPRLGKVAAAAIMEAAKTADRAGVKAVGFGGTHYSPKFTRLSIEGAYQIGHIVPRHALETGIPEPVLRDTLRKTIGPPKALIDWKGLRGEDRRKLVARLESWGYEIERC